MNVRIIAAAVIVTVTCGASPVVARQSQAPGQEVPSTTRMVLKGKAPVSKEILRVKLPRPQEADLTVWARVRGDSLPAAAFSGLEWEGRE